jgi:4-hydroxybenzoate polyprenyltransferase
LVFARELTERSTVTSAALAFAIFCALSSAVYLLNDLADRERDRLHPLKKNRPLAAGTLSVRAAVAALAGLLALSLGAASFLGAAFLMLSLSYLLLNLCYTLALKRIVIVDVMAVSLGYVIRVMAGGAAIAVEVSAWLLLCTIFLALFLTASKRRHELILLAGAAAEQREVLMRYSPAFLDQMINVVTASSLLSYALYATSPETAERFGSRSLIYTVPFVMFGIFRYLYLVYQVEDERSPTEAMLTDLPFLLNLLFWGASVWVILYWL